VISKQAGVKPRV